MYVKIEGVVLHYASQKAFFFFFFRSRCIVLSAQNSYHKIFI